MQAIRMLIDADGAPHGHTVYRYESGEMYRAGDTQPPMSEDLMTAFVASGRAVEVDENGNPVATPASRRARKSADASDVPEAAPESAQPAPESAQPAQE